MTQTTTTETTSLGTATAAAVAAPTIIPIETPTLGDRSYLAHDGEVRRSALVVASWARYAEGTDEAGEPITVVDRLADSLTASARTQREDRLAFIGNRQVFGDLVDDERFVVAYRDALDGLITEGAHATVTRLSRS